jgi:Peptidase family M1 domain/Peptidase M1 N-terminal domain/Immune inhibitor A-like, MAM domain
MSRRLAIAIVGVAFFATSVSAASAHGWGPSGSPGAAGIGDPYFPLDGNGGYDTRHYLLDLRYDPATDLLRGVATIRARATQDLSSFNLDLVGLNVRAIAVNGRPARWSRDAHELTITPRRTLHKHERFVVKIAYDGVPHTIVDNALGEGGFFNTDDGSLVAGQPHGAAAWYPVNDHPLDKAAYTFRVSVPTGLQVVANGVLKGNWTKRGWTTWLWDAPDPMASYLTTVDIGEFNLRSYRANGLRFWDAVDPDLYTRPEPRTGQQFALSQSADTTYKRLMHTVDVPAGGAQLSFWVNRDTEQNWDFFFVEAHTVGADDWTTLPDANGHTTHDTGLVCPYSLGLHPFLAHYESPTAEGGCSPAGTTGEWWARSGASDGYEQWVIDLSRFAGKQIEVSLSYASDDLFNFGGVEIDDVTVSTGQGTTGFEDDGDALDGWTVPGAPEGSAANANDWIAGTSADTPTPVGELIDAAFAREPDAIAFLSDLFGPYPFVAAGGIVDDLRGLGFALETQTRPVYGLGFFEDRAGPPDIGVIVHELAHQWTGDYLALGRWQDIWLNEGFATYTEWLWSEHEGQGTAQETFDAVTSIPPDDDFWKLAIGDPGPDHLFDGPVYDRGAATLHALRLKIGDDAFFQLLRRWVRQNAGGNVTTPQFIALAERISGQDLGAFFDEWLFTGERPASLPPVATAARVASAAAVARADRHRRTLRVLEARRR